MHKSCKSRRSQAEVGNHSLSVSFQGYAFVQKDGLQHQDLLCPRDLVSLYQATVLPDAKSYYNEPRMPGLVVQIHVHSHFAIVTSIRIRIWKVSWLEIKSLLQLPMNAVHYENTSSI